MPMIRKAQLNAPEGQTLFAASRLHSLAFLSSGRLSGLHSLIAFATELEFSHNTLKQQRIDG